MNPLLKHHYENIATDNAVTNEDGSLSTVKSSIVNINGKEMLIPTVWGGEILDGDRLNEAIDNAFDSNIEWPTEEGKDAVNKLRSLEVDLHKQMRPVTRKNAANELIQDADKNRTLEQRYAPIKKGVLDTSYGPIELKEINKEDLLNTNEESDKNSNSSNTNFLKEMQEKFSIGNFNVIPKLEGAEKGVNFKLEYAKGGKIMATPSEEQQMEMMLDGGGFNDQGGTVDPVSGNEVPIGNTQEGVRDDVPIMASEREYVVDAATVNYFGVQKYNDEKKAAAVGYQQMEQDGLLGQSTQGSALDSNEETPFTIADLDIADEEGKPLMMAEGGTVSTRRKLNTSLDDNVEVDPTIGRRPQPTFGDSMGGGGGFTFKMYTHPDGRNMMVPFMNGIPMFSIPEGFILTDPNAPVETPVADPTVTPAEIAKPVEFEGGPDGAGDVVSMEDMSSTQFNNLTVTATKAKNYKGPFKNIINAWGKNIIAKQDEIVSKDLDAVEDSFAVSDGTYGNFEGVDEFGEVGSGGVDGTPNADGTVGTPLGEFGGLGATVNPNVTSPTSYATTPTVTTPTVSLSEIAEVEASTENTTVAPGTGAEGPAGGGTFSPPSSTTPAAGTGAGGPAGGYNTSSGTPAAGTGAGGPAGGYSGGGNSGGDYGGAQGDWGGPSFGGDGGVSGLNKGGLAGKKPKKKMKTYKKGGLATSKK